LTTFLLFPPVTSGGAPSGAQARSPQRAGQALRAAIDARKAGDLDRAEKLFAAVAKEYPVIADHARLLRAAALLEGQEFALAISAVRE